MPFNFNGNNITAVNWNGNSISTVNYNGTEVWGSTPPVTIEPFYIENRDASNSITTTVVHGSSAPSISLEYSLDKSTWTAYTLDTAVTVPASGKCYFRAPEGVTNYKFASNNADTYINKFSASGPCNAGGDITTLLKKGGIENISSGSYNHVFQGLFKQCTNLIDASKLVISFAVTPEHCFHETFYACSGLEVAPSLTSITGVNPYAFYTMFANCSALKEAPAMPNATYAGTYTYTGMFTNCVNLKSAVLNFTTLGGSHCCDGMFLGCIKLQYLEAKFTAWNDSVSATSQWLSTTTPEILKLVLPDAIGTDLEQTHNVSHVPSGTCVLENNATYNLPLTFRVLTLTNSVAQIKLQANGNPNPVELQYSRDGTTWTDYTIGDTLQFTTTGNYVQFRAKTTNSLFSAGGSDCYQFVADEGTFVAMGNIMSLLDSSMQTNTVPNYAFYNLFMNFNGITMHVRCPATDLGTWCYAGLFRASPHQGNKRAFTEFPATYAAERCYQTMYMDDAYLKYIPTYSATSGGNNCFMRTFQNCSSIDMDSYKINLTSLPYRCMYEMFTNGGTIRNFELLATELGDRSLNNLFVNANPQHIKVHFSDWYWDGLYATDNWVNNIITDTSDCIFECPTALGTQATINRGVAYCPTNWTVVNY